MCEGQRCTKCRVALTLTEQPPNADNAESGVRPPLSWPVFYPWRGGYFQCINVWSHSWCVVHQPVSFLFKENCIQSLGMAFHHNGARDMWEPFNYDHDSTGWHVGKTVLKQFFSRLHPKLCQTRGRPICISRALLQLTNKGLLKKCQQYFGQYIPVSSPKVLQTGGSIRNGETFMHILLSSMLEESAVPSVFLSLDSSNPFIWQLPAVLLKGVWECLCSASTYPKQAAFQFQPHCWTRNLLRKFIAADDGWHCFLNFFHNSSATDIKSESGVQQGDLLVSTFFFLAIHPSYWVLLDCPPSIFLPMQIMSFSQSLCLWFVKPITRVQSPNKDHWSACLQQPTSHLCYPNGRRYLLIYYWLDRLQVRLYS